MAMHMRQGVCIKKHFRIVDFHVDEHFRERLWERGKFVPTIEGGRPRTARTVLQEQRILAHVAANPGTSTRTISAAEGVHRDTVWRYYTNIGCIHIICNLYRVLSWRICLAV